MTGNNELGKYLRYGITCCTVSRIFRLEPAERAKKKLRAKPKMLERVTTRSMCTGDMLQRLSSWLLQVCTAGDSVGFFGMATVNIVLPVN